MSPTEQMIGNVTGSIGRFLWEAAVARGASGGKVNMNAISDTIGEKVVGALAKHGLSPASRIGQNVLSFAANLAGTIPEDILQTSLDNVLTYNIDDNKHLLEPGQMSENLKSNFIVMSLFNVAKAGMNSIKRARLAKQLAQQADMNQVINIEGISADVDDLTRAVKNGGEIKVDSEKVSVTDVDGNTKVLENITPEQGEMIQRSLLGDTATLPDVADTLKPGDKIQIQVNYGGTDMWVDANVIEEGGKKYIVGDSFEDKLPMDSTVIKQVRTTDGSPIAKATEVEAIYYSNRAELDSALARYDVQSATQYLLDAGLDDAEFNKRLSSLPESVQEAVRNQIDKYGNPGQYDYASFRRALTNGTSDIIIDNEMLRASAKAPELETPKLDTSKIESSETPKSETAKVDYEYTPINDALNMEIRPNQADIKDWHTRTHARIMNDFDNNFINKFHNKFGDVQASDFDWVWYQSKQGKTPA
jgi:hypothetical protein